MSIAVTHKNRLLAVFLAIFFGVLGVDRFYLGKWKTGILKAITIGGLGLWWFFDGAALMLDAFLHSLGKDTGFVKDSNGNDLKYGFSMYRYKNGKFVRDWC